MDTITEQWWFQVINIPILILIFLILNEFIFRRNTEISLWISIFAMISIPIYATMYSMDWIQFVTLIALCLGVLFVTFYRYSHLKSEYIKSKCLANKNVHKWSKIYFKFKPWVLPTIYSLFIIDLLLTAIKELLNTFHYNAISALFLCFTFPIPLNGTDPPLWSISPMNTEKDERNDVIIRVSFGFVISYTSFAACYIYANYLNGFVRGIALLLIPIINIICNYEKGMNLWAQTRLYTLWFYYILKVFSFNSLNKYMYCTDDWRLLSDHSHYELITFWGLINAILSCLQFLYWIFNLSKMTKSLENVNNIKTQIIDDHHDQNNESQHDQIESFNIDHDNDDDDENAPLSASQY